MPLLTLTNAHLAYGHHALLDGVDFMVDEGERIGLIGRNGGGKSSLLKVVVGEAVLDDGVLWRTPGLRTGYVPQEPMLDDAATVLQTVSAGLQGHEDGWVPQYKVETVLSQLGLAGDQRIASLSGGWKKRVAIARALVAEPDLLVLDEPTNHLDIASIEWLETLLLDFRGSLLFVTHDRQFLDRLATRIVELDRGLLSSYGPSFAEYQRRKGEQLAAEATAQAKFDKVLAQEEVWIRKGVEARRTRNEGRVRRLEALRLERVARRERMGQVRLALDAGERSGNLVAELSHVTFRHGAQVLVRDYSTRILRGDRVGIIGPNGAGKTTLLRLLLGELQPQEGSVRLGTRLAVAYYDQLRSQLDPEATLADTISPGADFVEIQGVRKHVVSYLGDFLFSPERVRAKVKSLSGGERNRLLLARLFARPANVLVLDEPTNDLDIETLDLLESLLAEYDGTLFLVSHDRAFLDNVVTQVIVLDGQGGITENAGGYSDWVRYLASLSGAQTTPQAMRTGSKDKAPGGERPKARPEKLSYKETRDLEALPQQIEDMEAEQAAIAARLTDPELYKGGPEAARSLQARHAELESAIESAMERWEALEQKRSRLAGNPV
ncbi:MAG: ATP-binding cassette domain-containing protein [Betaproteobacteria bacterium]|nr:ATP-binding cassette domain-containing protein [Betaproteobacteria bacterium]